MSDDMEQVAQGPSETRSRAYLWPRLALVQAVLLLAAVVVALPVAFRSMGILLTEGQTRTLYEFPGGQAATAAATAALEESESYFNIAAIDLDEDKSSITLAISGHRICPDAGCSTLNLTLVSLEDDADVRRALPPSAPMTLTPDQEVFSQTIQLPARGQPSLYPFDDYVLWLGVSGTVVDNGEKIRLTPGLLAQRAVITTQNQLRGYLMVP